MNKRESQKKLIIVGIFSIAMGFLEGIVVVYLRALYYPNGFAFPLTNIPAHIIRIELVREVSTIIMLVSIGIIAGKNSIQKFAYFIYAFGVWDIFYYVALKIFLNWPPSLLTWDILFLIPITWVGPVMAPVICSLTMILLSYVIIFFNNKIEKIQSTEWLLIILGAISILVTYLWDFSKLIIEKGLLSQLNSLDTNSEFQKIVSAYVPVTFNWYLFGMGELLILCAVALIFKRSVKG